MPNMKVAVISQLLLCAILPFAGSSEVKPTHLRDLPILVPETPEIDAISLLDSRARNQDTIFKEAIQLLDSLKSSPSCNRAAATRLVVSCQAFGGGQDRTQMDSPETIDLMRSIYAARLAICEIEGAGAVIPTSCLPVTAKSSPQKGRFGFGLRHKSSDNGSDEIPREVLEQCLQTLEARPQWWTSYSNSRQNALIICQASRIETEKEELLDLHRSIAKSSLKLNNGIRDALRDAAVQSEHQKVFVQAVHALQQRILMEAKQTESFLQRTFGNYLRGLEQGIAGFQDSIFFTLLNIRTGTEVLEKKIHNASSQVGALQQALQTVHHDALIRSQEAAQVQESKIAAHGDLADILHHSLESLLDSDMVKVYRGMQKFDAALEWLNSRMNMVLEQENRMTERLQKMETIINQSESKANELQDAQEQQMEALAEHSRTQEAIQFQAKVSEALLSKTSIAAANLQSILEDAAIKYKSVPGFYLGGYSIWSLCGILLLIIAAQNFRVAISLVFLSLAHSIALTIFPFF